MFSRNRTAQINNGVLILDKWLSGFSESNSISLGGSKDLDSTVAAVSMLNSLFIFSWSAILFEISKKYITNVDWSRGVFVG